MSTPGIVLAALAIVVAVVARSIVVSGEVQAAAKVVAELARLSEHAPRKTGEPPPLLSPREMEVLQLLARGASNKEIAATLHLAEGRVKNHVTSSFVKLGVEGRTEAAIKARDLGLL